MVFSSFICRISERTWASTGGRPPLGRDFHCQNKRNPWRCQPITVSGLTMMMAERHSDQIRDSHAQNSRSRRRSCGRFTERFSTASCWRRARFSTVNCARDTNATRTNATNAFNNPISRLPCTGKSPFYLIASGAGRRRKSLWRRNDEIFRRHRSARRRMAKLEVAGGRRGGVRPQLSLGGAHATVIVP